LQNKKLIIIRKTTKNILSLMQDSSYTYFSC